MVGKMSETVSLFPGNWRYHPARYLGLIKRSFFQERSKSRRNFTQTFPRPRTPDASAPQPERTAVAEVADFPVAETESAGGADAGEDDGGHLEGGAARRHPDAVGASQRRILLAVHRRDRKDSPALWSKVSTSLLLSLSLSPALSL